MTTLKKMALVAAIALTSMFAVNATNSTAEAGGHQYWGGYKFNYGCHSYYNPYIYKQYYYKPVYKVYRPFYPVYPVYGGYYW
ncbi:MAG: hypothetical protein MPJ50_00385 [Pirellulales bacterium]|nr:hypothetical protein [Pirellulales bacterium]